MVPELCNLPYTDRLHSLSLPSLVYRRRWGDMIFVYQLFHDNFTINSSVFFLLLLLHQIQGVIITKNFKSHTCCLARSEC